MRSVVNVAHVRILTETRENQTEQSKVVSKSRTQRNSVTEFVKTVTRASLFGVEKRRKGG